MPRNMSFMLTTEQIRNRTKTVTRRLGWDFLKPGDVLNACVKCQGLKKGEHPEVICQIRVLCVRKEPLDKLILLPSEWGRRQVDAEGFPELSTEKFVAMFCKHMRCDSSTVVNRIEFEYV